MVGKVQSLTKKKQTAQKEKDELMNRALQLYLSSNSSSKGGGARSICKQVSEEHERATGQVICLNYSTLLCWVAGGVGMSEFNSGKGKLLEPEVSKLLDFVQELAERAMPLSYRTLAEYANYLLEARLGPNFEPVGQNWPARFVERHSDHIKMYYSSPLDRSRA